MAILKDLIVTGNSRIESLRIGVSGEVKEGDFRAINGNALLNFSKYKRVYFLENSYEQATLPIFVDDLVKTTGKVVIYILKCNSVNLNIPRYIQFYDPDDWISTHGIIIYVTLNIPASLTNFDGQVYGGGSSYSYNSGYEHCVYVYRNLSDTHGSNAANSADHVYRFSIPQTLTSKCPTVKFTIARGDNYTTLNRSVIAESGELRYVNSNSY